MSEKSYLSLVITCRLVNRKKEKETSASARSISCHMAPVDAQNSAIPVAIPQMGEDLSDMCPNHCAKFHANR